MSPNRNAGDRCTDASLHGLPVWSFWEIEARGEHQRPWPARNGIHPVRTVCVEQHNIVDQERHADKTRRS
jgi:hypothetical protein